MPTAAEILRLYASLIGDVAVRRHDARDGRNDLPGGHSPGYFAMINNPLPMSPSRWRNDPAAFNNFPEFFIAHEIAHQWWGQAVGWKNYHEQWLSEGFAQYFAALYAQERRGEQSFRDVLRQFRRWAIEESDQGPIYLGYRLGHIKDDSRVFRALVYNKGARGAAHAAPAGRRRGVLQGLRRFYADNRFKKAGTDDLRRRWRPKRRRQLDRFFQRWIYESSLPRMRFTPLLKDRSWWSVSSRPATSRHSGNRGRDLQRRQDRRVRRPGERGHDRCQIPVDGPGAVG